MAQNIRDSSYGLVFGVNTFAALLFQTLLTMAVADDVGLALPPRQQVRENAALLKLVIAPLTVRFVSLAYTNS